MSDWTCPDCGGGFPRPAKRAQTSDEGNTFSVYVCPWCSTEVPQPPKTLDDADAPRVGDRL